MSTSTIPVTTTPLLSVIVIAYNMPRQLSNTLYSLSVPYQRDCRQDEYEVIVLENKSDNNLPASEVAHLPPNIHYHLREETSPSPVNALNYGLTLSKGHVIGLIIDGARMLSPRVVSTVLSCYRRNPKSIVAIPGYHIGSENHENFPPSHADEEQRQLAALDWKSDGYNLFTNACLSTGNAHGYFKPLMEANALFCPALALNKIGGIDTDFQYRGGGSINLHVFRQLGLLQDHQYTILFAEGNFHQFHGGVTTSNLEQRQAMIDEFDQQLVAKWGGKFHGLRRRPLYSGAITRQALPFLTHCALGGQIRFARFAKNNANPWPDDTDNLYRAQPHSIDAKPRLSIIVVIYKMPRQAMNTIYSLSTPYQQNVSSNDYEIIIAENDSAERLTAVDISKLPPNARYFLRNEPAPTPVYAINEAVDSAQGSHICLMIDGARMVTPGLVSHTLELMKENEHALIAAPGYHLGQSDHKHNVKNGYNERAEQKLLNDINWKTNGYKLFNVSCFSGANSHGYLHPLMESNCLTFNIEDFRAIGGAHTGFQTPGGGSVNLDIYRQLALLPHSKLYVLFSEGSFHQFHGGVTTQQVAELEEVLASHREEMKSIRGEYYSAALIEPILYGYCDEHALPFLIDSCNAAQRRFQRFFNQNSSPWPDEISYTHPTHPKS